MTVFFPTFKPCFPSMKEKKLPTNLLDRIREIETRVFLRLALLEWFQLSLVLPQVCSMVGEDSVNVFHDTSSVQLHCSLS